MPEISITNTINISLSATPQGLKEPSTASVVIFSNEPCLNSNEYTAHVTPSTVVTDYGIDSLTAEMANALFAPSPNFRTGKGTLYVVPFIAENATSGSLTTATVASNLVNFSTVKNGSLTIKIDGKETILKQLNFTGVTSIKEIVNVLLSRDPDCYIEAIKDGEQEKIKLTSKLVGTDSTIVITSTVGEGTDISGTNYLNALSATTTAGVNSVDTETMIEALNRVENKISFGGILTTQFKENAKVLEHAKSIQTKRKVYAEATNSLDNIEILCKENKLSGQAKTRLIGYSEGAKNAKMAAAAYLSVALSPNFNASNTANTLNLKELPTISPDEGLNQTYFLSAKNNGCDIYGNTGGLGCVYSNNNGGYTDDVYNQIWLEGQLEIAGFNYLKQTNTKVPQTETGMTGLKNAYEKVLIKAKRAGIIGEGLKWNSSNTFGDPEDFHRNITEQGYYIYSLPISEQAQTEREERIAPVVQIAMKFAGAIHSSDVIGIIER